MKKKFDGMTNWFFCKKGDTLQFYSTNTKQVNVNAGAQIDAPTAAGIVYVIHPAMIY
jgi:hypothetical protein